MSFLMFFIYLFLLMAVSSGFSNQRCIIKEQTAFFLQLVSIILFLIAAQGCFPPSVASAPPIIPYTAAPINPGGNLEPYNW